MSLLFILILCALTLILTLVVFLYLVTRNRKEKKSELGIFHHPSNFKKAPIEWVQQPKEEASDNATKKF